MSGDIVHTIGALEIGAYFNALLLGIVTAQSYTYYSKNFQDPWWLRCFVAVIWFLEVTQTFLSSAYIYDQTILSAGNPDALSQKRWTFGLSTLMIDIVSTMVQVYYAYRIRILSGRLFLPIVSWTGSTLHFICALIEVIFEYDPSIGDNSRHQFQWSEYTTLVFDIIVDTINTAGLSVFLYRQMKQNELPRTRRLVNKLIVWTIESGLITMMTAIISLILFFATPDTEIWAAVALFYAKLYSNTLLALLNGRSSLQATEVRPSFVGISRPFEISVPQGRPIHVHTMLAPDTPSGRDAEETIVHDSPIAMKTHGTSLELYTEP